MYYISLKYVYFLERVKKSFWNKRLLKAETLKK